MFCSRHFAKPVLYAASLDASNFKLSSAKNISNSEEKSLLFLGKATCSKNLNAKKGG
jgi:hypothetical protein